MSLIRLKRQDFHTCICSLILILINSCISYLVNQSVMFTAFFAVFYMICEGLAGAFDLQIRKKDDLIIRHMISGALIVVITAVLSQTILRQLLLFLLCNICYGIWVVLAKRWIHHEISPGCTLLLYDNPENLEKAKAIVESRKDLMADAYHFRYDGTEDLGQIVQILRIPQIVICLESDTDKVMEYCKKAGVTAFIKENAACTGIKIDKEGLCYIRPIPTAWNLFLKGCKGVFAK